MSLIIFEEVCTDLFCLLPYLKCELHEDSAPDSVKLCLRNGRWGWLDALPGFDEGRERKRRREERLNVTYRAPGIISFLDMKPFLMGL